MDMNLSKLQELVMGVEARPATVHGGLKELDMTEHPNWMEHNIKHKIEMSKTYIK